jgi:hypothetical protein
MRYIMFHWSPIPIYVNQQPFRICCLAQSLLQRPPTVASTSAQFAFATGETTFGQRCHAITRAVFHSFLSFAQRLFAGGYSWEQVTEAVMPT